MDKYRVGIIGTGFGTKVQFPAFQKHPRFEVVALAGRNPEKTKNIADDLQIPYNTSDWTQLLNLDLDLISVVTPPYLHFEMSSEIIRRGINILMEKPTTSNAYEAKQLYRLVQTKNVVGAISHEFRYLPNRLYIHDLIQNGKIGNLREVHLHQFFGFAARKDNPKYGWLWNSLYDGGILGALGSHLVDWMRFTMKNEIKRVAGQISTRTPMRMGTDEKLHRVSADDGFAILFETDNNIHGNIIGTGTTLPTPTSRLILGGDNGTIVLDGNNLYFGEIGGKLERLDIPETYAMDMSLNDKDYRIPPYLKLLDRLAKQLNGEEVGIPSFYDGWQNQLVLDAVRQSYQTNSWINIVE